MPPFPIVPTLDPGEYRQTGLGLSGVTMTINQFPLDRRKETLARSIVPAVAFPTHTLSRFRFLESRFAVVTGILRSPVTVKKQTALGLPVLLSPSVTT